MPKFVIHIGLQKTASTFLQDMVFPNLTDIRFLESRYQNSEAYLFINELKKPPGQYNIDRFSGELKNITTKYSDQDTVLISSEGLAANIHRHEIAKRIQEIIPDATILLVLREQFSMVESAYLQLSRGFGKKRDYISFSHFLENEFYTMGFINRLEYFDISEMYRCLFGRTNIKLLFFEDLAKDRKYFLEKLLFDIGSDLNYPDLNLNKKKVHSRLTRREQVFSQFTSIFLNKKQIDMLRKYTPVPVLNFARKLLKSGKKSTVNWPKNQVQKIEELSKKQNTLIEVTYGLDLHSRGYLTNNSDKIEKNHEY